MRSAAFGNDQSEEAAVGAQAQAVAALQAVVAKEPQHFAARFYLRDAQWGRAQALMRLDRDALALEDCEQAIKLAQGREGNAYELGRATALAHLGQHARATVAVEAVTNRSPTGGNLYEAASVYALSAAAARGDAQLASVDQALRP